LGFNVAPLFGFCLSHQIMQNHSPEWIEFRFQPIAVMGDVVALDEVLHGASGIAEGAAKGREVLHGIPRGEGGE
jgi:hypothetical protein